MLYYFWVLLYTTHYHHAPPAHPHHRTAPPAARAYAAFTHARAPGAYVRTILLPHTHTPFAIPSLPTTITLFVIDSVLYACRRAYAHYARARAHSYRAWRTTACARVPHPASPTQPCSTAYHPPLPAALRAHAFAYATFWRGACTAGIFVVSVPLVAVPPCSDCDHAGTVPPP